jgi:hypothetical protein
MGTMQDIEGVSLQDIDGVSLQDHQQACGFFPVCPVVVMQQCLELAMKDSRTWTYQTLV